MLYTALYMASRRTQIYLTHEQRKGLDTLRGRDGKSLAEVVREAVDAYLENQGATPTDALAATRGALPDIEAPPRTEWERGYG